MRGKMTFMIAAWACGSLALACVVQPSEVGASPGPQLSIVAGKIGKTGMYQAGKARRSRLGEPYAVALDQKGDLYIADLGANNGKSTGARIEKVGPNGNLSLFAGNGKSGAPQPGAARRSPLGEPLALAVDRNGNLIVADTTPNGAGLVLKITPAGKLNVIAGNGKPGSPKPGKARRSPLGPLTGAALDPAGNLYICESGSDFSGSSQVLKISTRGHLSIFAGNGRTGSPKSGKATRSPLGDLTGLATDRRGDVYIADGGQDGVNDNGVVEKVTRNGRISIVAGKLNVQGAPKPGKATRSPLDFPEGVATDNGGNLYIADGDLLDGGNCAIEKVSPKGILSVVAGRPTRCGTVKPGQASRSPLNPIADIAVDRRNRLYVADTYNYVVERIS